MVCAHFIIFVCILLRVHSAFLLKIFSHSVSLLIGRTISWTMSTLRTESIRKISKSSSTNTSSSCVVYRLLSVAHSEILWFSNRLHFTHWICLLFADYAKCIYIYLFLFLILLFCFPLIETLRELNIIVLCLKLEIAFLFFLLEIKLENSQHLM